MLLYGLWIALCIGLVFIAFTMGKRSPQATSHSHALSLPHIEKVYSRRKRSIDDYLIKMLAYALLLSVVMIVCTAVIGVYPWSWILSSEDHAPYQRMKADLFIIDCSGSMGQPFSPHQGRSKLQCVQQALYEAIQMYDTIGSRDLIGVNTFARTSQTLAPLTYERRYLFQRIQEMSPVSEEKLNGTATGYALYKAVVQLVASKMLGNEWSTSERTSRRNWSPPRCILISDGIEEPHPNDAQDPFRALRLLPALECARQNGIRVDYLLLMNNSFSLAADEKERLRSACIATGGQYIEVEYESALQDVLTTLLGQGAPPYSFSFPRSSSSISTLCMNAAWILAAMTVLRALRYLKGQHIQKR